ncbi:MAG: nucleotide exchange factor GrpE [Enterobacterales bacterium]
MLSNKKNNIKENKYLKENEKDKNIKLKNKKNKIEFLDDKDKYINKLENSLKETKKLSNDNFLRYRAEIENLIKRNEKDLEKSNKFAIEKFAIELLPVIDSLEKTIEMFNIKNLELKSIFEGVNLTLKFLLNTVNKFGINTINDINVIFNPNIHQAMNIIKSNKHKSNYIINIMQKGYILNGRLIRPAMVTVSK